MGLLPKMKKKSTEVVHFKCCPGSEEKEGLCHVFFFNIIHIQIGQFQLCLDYKMIHILLVF